MDTRWEEQLVGCSGVLDYLVLKVGMACPKGPFAPSLKDLPQHLVTVFKNPMTMLSCKLRLLVKSGFALEE